jgi:hypothetical protein
MSNISCDIIKDLLPLYYDNICSEESRKLIDEHIANCKICKNELEKIKSDIHIQKNTIARNNEESKVIKNLAGSWKRTKRKAFLKGLLGASIVCTLIILCYIGLFKWQITKVPTEIVEITDISKMKNGQIAYHVKFTDGYALNYCKFDVDNRGNFYIIPYRPIIKAKTITNVGLHNMYYTFDEIEEEKNRNINITALYIKTRDDNLLVWKEEMKLPKASEEVENNFSFN